MFFYNSNKKYTETNFSCKYCLGYNSSAIQDIVNPIWMRSECILSIGQSYIHALCRHTRYWVILQAYMLCRNTRPVLGNPIHAWALPAYSVWVILLACSLQAHLVLAKIPSNISRDKFLQICACEV